MNVHPRRALGPEVDEAFAASVLATLSEPQKRLESKWLYDETGSRLFDRITALEDYYPTRTETTILREKAGGLREIVPDGAALIEPGAGSGTKTRILLDALPRLGAYVPVDISGAHLHAAAAGLRRDYPALPVHPVVGDFTDAFSLPSRLRSSPSVVFFPGSTIGNFEPDAARALLGRFRAIPGVAGLVVGADLRKDPERLVRAYDDREGVTAAFNLNLLERINRELGGDFDLAGFVHEARWNEGESRIEMHLRSVRDQAARVLGRRFVFRHGETIHTENSHKFTPDSFRAIAGEAGWAPADLWIDPDRLFSVHVMVPRA
jgi:L-histidine Nalpha-methyltransferase